MEKYLYVLIVAAAVSMGVTTTATAGFENCEQASKEATWYQSKAGALFTAYGACKATEWVTHANCGKIHKHAENYQKKSNYWHKQWVDNCVKD